MIAASMGTGGKRKKGEEDEQSSSDGSKGGKQPEVDAQVSDNSICTCLANLHDRSTVGIDPCNDRACSTEREDFLTLDESEVVRGVSNEWHRWQNRSNWYWHNGGNG